MAGGSPSGCDYPDNAVRLWDLGTGELLAVMTGHRNRVNSVAFSPDGTRIASASQDQTVRVWDAASGKPVAVLQGHTSHVIQAIFSPDGTRGRLRFAGRHLAAVGPGRRRTDLRAPRPCRRGLGLRL